MTIIDIARRLSEGAFTRVLSAIDDECREAPEELFERTDESLFPIFETDREHGEPASMPLFVGGDGTVIIRSQEPMGRGATARVFPGLLILEQSGDTQGINVVVKIVPVTPENRALCIQVAAEGIVANALSTSQLGHSCSGVVKGYGLVIADGWVGAVLERGAPLNRSQGMSVAAIRRIACDVLESLRALHAAEIVHNDIKPQNLFVCEDRVKIGDIGALASSKGEPCCLCATCKDDSVQLVAEPLRGTPMFMSLEACCGISTEANDIWSLALSLFVLSGGDLPFDDLERQHPEMILRRCRKNGHNVTVDLDCRELEEPLRGFLEIATTTCCKRPSAESLLKHPLCAGDL